MLINQGNNSSQSSVNQFFLLFSITTHTHIMDQDQTINNNTTTPQPITYQCANCSTDNEFKPREPIRCRECGHRVMYKKRTKRMIQFEAR
jgi:DNA-directed RNA polymerase I, II, and III subunit RPABC4